VIARNRNKEKDALRGWGRQFLAVDGNAASSRCRSSSRSPAIPEGLVVAVDAPGNGGGVVLIGSPRRVTRDLSLEGIGEKRLEVVGSHISAIEHDRSPSAPNFRRRLGREFLGVVTTAQTWVDDLVGPALDLREAPHFYESLSERSNQFGAHSNWRFSWERAAAEEPTPG
jgi:hypothetical protein